MCFSIPTVKRPNQCYVVVLLMQYPKTSFAIVVFGLLTSTTLLICRVHVSEAHRGRHIIEPIFHSDSLVIDISNGSLDTLRTHLQRSTFQFVMYYAHWCASSRKIVYEFHRASKKFKDQVTFIAINCWVGTCRHKNHFHFYPHLYFHHSMYHGVEYKRSHKTVHLTKFIHDALYPFIYISNHLVLQKFLEQGKPSLIAFFNGTNYQNVEYNAFFGAALFSINKVSALQFGVITSFQVASLVGLKTFGQVVLKNVFESPQMYPPSLNFTSSDLLHWAEKNKVEYVEELEPDVTELKYLRIMMKSSPFVLLFLPKNTKDFNDNLLNLYHKVSLAYHNCSCKIPNSNEHLADGLPIKTAEDEHAGSCGELLKRPHITSCQSLPLGLVFRYGMQNVCDVCQECYQMCSCDVNAFPLGLSTSSVLRNLTPLHNTCRSLRKNYHENNFLSVCCFPKTMPRFREMILSQYFDSLDEKLQTGLTGNEHLTVFADELNNLKGSIDDAVSRKNPGILKRVLRKLLTLFSTDTPGNEGMLLGDSVGAIAGSEEVSTKSEYHEYGTCNQRGKVRVFAGAGCYSNKTVKFYYMDSRKYWNYAKALGVRDLVSRAALVIVDIKNEAQYVLPEETEITNTTIVDFIMNFTHANLTRRLRSAPVPTQSCPNDSCIIEVVSLSFDKLVLDPNKDVLLMYYTPWCGFCKTIKPIYLALAGHYKQSKDVTIARINADLNDLPWQYTVDSYPTFIFFPARRKDLSVVYPDDEQLTLKNFIQFMEKQRSIHSRRRHDDTTTIAKRKMRKLEKENAFLKRQNNILLWRLRRQRQRRFKADKRWLDAERQFAVLLNANFDDKRSQRALEDKVEQLEIVNGNLLDQLLETRQKMRKLQEEMIRTSRELRAQNIELENPIFPVETSDGTGN